MLEPSPHGKSRHALRSVLQVLSTAVLLAAGTLLADWAWLRKRPWAAVINFGRETLALTSSYGVYVGILWISGVDAPGMHVATIPALFFFALTYFLFGRLLFYVSLILVVIWLLSVLRARLESRTGHW